MNMCSSIAIMTILLLCRKVTQSKDITAHAFQNLGNYKPISVLCRFNVEVVRLCNVSIFNVFFFSLIVSSL